MTYAAFTCSAFYRSLLRKIRSPTTIIYKQVNSRISLIEISLIEISATQTSLVNKRRSPLERVAALPPSCGRSPGLKRNAIKFRFISSKESRGKKKVANGKRLSALVSQPLLTTDCVEPAAQLASPALWLSNRTSPEAP